MRISLSDLFLAYRQAKTTLFFEKRGVGLVELARFEANLAENLRALQRRLQEGKGWFYDIQPGEMWVVPKRRRVSKGSDAPQDRVTIIADTMDEGATGGLDIQLRLSPSPEFAIVEILYIWRFGPTLDSIIPEQSLGYRLNLRQGRVPKEARWVFEYWPKRYDQFRREGIEAARLALQEDGQNIDVLTADLATFYDTVDASFLTTERFVNELAEFSDGIDGFDLAAFQAATTSLLDVHNRILRRVTALTGVRRHAGIPIGALTSRLIANVALASFDRSILATPALICYRRYVDDFIIVGRSGCPMPASLDQMMDHYLPSSRSRTHDFELDVMQLDRSGSEFCLQRQKCRAHRLQGQAGQHFLSAIASDFQQLVSEHRAFMDISVLDPVRARRIIRAGKDPEATVRSLRDADRTKLEHFALSTALGSLERLTMMVAHSDARRLVRAALEGLDQLVADHQLWVENVDSALRLLRLAVATQDWEAADSLIARMDRIWGDIEGLSASVSGVFYHGRRVERRAAWTSLRNYLHEARLEAVCTAIAPDSRKDGAVPLAAGLRYRTKRLTHRTLIRRARSLALADLRALDREDDVHLLGDFDGSEDNIVKGLRLGKAINQRLRIIDRFVERARDLGDDAWDIMPARLFLSVRPPTYYDVARRWLYDVERDGFREGIFEDLLDAVNAIRGTAYQEPVGEVTSPSGVRLPSHHLTIEDLFQSPLDPRLVLGNMGVDDSAFVGAAKKRPIQSVDRLRSLATVLDRAGQVARSGGRRRASLLVLPELSIPRRWLREIANYIVRYGNYGFIAGVEYHHHKTKPVVFNQVHAVLPGPFSSVATWPWTKRRPADVEQRQLAALGLRFPTFASVAPHRIVVDSPYGRMSVLICSELIETRRVADLLKRAELIVVPSWNTDTASYDHLIQSVGLQLHAVIAIANNGVYSDCRAWAPRFERWQRDLCRMIERRVDDVVFTDVPLGSLRAFHGDVPRFGVDRKATSRSRKPEWKPLPPDWTLLEQGQEA